MGRMAAKGGEQDEAFDDNGTEELFKRRHCDCSGYKSPLERPLRWRCRLMASPTIVVAYQ